MEATKYNAESMQSEKHTSTESTTENAAGNTMQRKTKLQAKRTCHSCPHFPGIGNFSEYKIISKKCLFEREREKRGPLVKSLQFGKSRLFSSYQRQKTKRYKKKRLHNSPKGGEP